jgi:hypothetical protein
MARTSFSFKILISSPLGDGKSPPFNLSNKEKNKKKEENVDKK